MLQVNKNIYTAFTFASHWIRQHSKICENLWPFISDACSFPPLVLCGLVYELSVPQATYVVCIGCSTKIVACFGRVYCSLIYIDVTKRAYIQNWPVTIIWTRIKVRSSCGSRYCTSLKWRVTVHCVKYFLEPIAKPTIRTRVLCKVLGNLIPLSLFYCRFPFFVTHLLIRR